ncbi:uncharacterized protein LOC103838475 [Brassica rapa]|uniref:uncharacterized protein LOC103838475 n=1 Tax=Brassica campestris TaxID=3711 RepID=UPI0004F1C03B|nr:uncharacterized protein LOC103838475 [Brassica rapa]XP_048596162.1 uncharacterized protein LOC125577969 [Brassica napus]
MVFTSDSGICFYGVNVDYGQSGEVNPGSNDVCVLCNNAPESRSHLFFECKFSAQLWEFIAKGLLCNLFTTTLSEIIPIISDKTREKKSLLCIRYAFQAVLYALWRERNKLKHGDKMMPLPVLKRVAEKRIHNRINLVCRSGVRGMEEHAILVSI